MRNWLAVLAAAAFAPACYGSNAAFPCTDDTQCTDGPGGVCHTQEPRLCTYSDGTCGPAGRYGNNAGSLSGKCVEGSSNGDVDAAVIDAPHTVPPDAQTFCYGSTTSLVKVCLAAAPNKPLVIAGAATVLDTSDANMCTPTLSGADNYCVIAATDITITSTLRAIGPKPLVLIATGSITSGPIALLDVSSHRSQGNSVLGAGHDPSTCTPGTAPTNHGGGAGGSFAGKGGIGGDGTATNTGGKPGDAVAAVNALRGGCAGQDGDNNAGSAGHGGGAVYLIAGVKIDLGGALNAGGQGGLGGANGANAKGGGGGGGAGGMIGFDAPSIKASNAVAANGGGGGEGSSQQGNNGRDGSDATGTGAPAGGTGGSTSGGDGGAGAAGAAAGAGDPGKPNGGGDSGGGGGGGGAGLIKAPAIADLGDNVSPLSTP